MTKSPLRKSNAVSLTNGSGTRGATLIISSLVKLVHGLPVAHAEKKIKEPMSTEDFYFNVLFSAFLVLAGGVFAGLTLGLMGQDEVYLKVMATSGEPNERKHARKVLTLIGRGKHWVLVTLLLCNVITNETLPIVLDSFLGGGWPAVVASTGSIVVFGEIIPQSICVRYGLQVGALFSPFVLVLMYVMYPVAYPCALLLDHILGEDHGTVYKKSGLKTLVTLHKTMGVERLNQDEVTIISAVLDLKEKPVSQIMTPIDRVYIMPSDRILDEKTVEEIFNAGFSRIPIHLPNEPSNFIGMLLVRVLISYDPEDALPVALFPLATLPETSSDTSCLNILNYFQEGTSHMIIVSESPGGPTGALGVLTLEDVIEELIGEEIIDESDVYIDINKNIKRKNPGPLYKRNLTAYLHNLYGASNNPKNHALEDISNNIPPIALLNSTFKGTPGSASPNRVRGSVPTLVNSPLLTPVNPASNPLETSKSFVKIKRPNPMESSHLNVPPKTVPIDTDLVVNGKADPKNVFDTVFTSEQGALDAAKERDRELDTNSNFYGGSGGSTVAAISISKEQRQKERQEHECGPRGVPEYQELRSYRTGGIVESVVNVHGVHKTIIEELSESESSERDSDELMPISASESARLIP